MSTATQVIPRISDCNVTELAQILEEAVSVIGDFVHLGAEYEKVQLLLERSSLNLGFVAEGRLKQSKQSVIGAILSEKQKKYLSVTDSLKTLGLSTQDIDKENDKRVKAPLPIWLMAGTTKATEAKRATVFQQEIDMLHPRLMAATDKLENSSAVACIPEDYRYLYALQMILKYVKNQRASVWEKCVNLFHDEQFKLESLEFQREQLVVSRQIQRDTKRLSVLACVAAYNTLRL